DLIAIRVRPRSSRSGLEKGSDGGIVVCVHAAAREGAANRECEVVLAKALGVAKSAVRIIRGEKGRGTQIAVAGLSAAETRARLDQAAEGKAS
ncbi:MAG TPA: DUF167 domain-containing protein, partial [Armatimonadota bacterium]|nr:DUF167 domain-containing protein [Armatimonadota bacterium]